MLSFPLSRSTVVRNEAVSVRNLHLAACFTETFETRTSRFGEVSGIAWYSKNVKRWQSGSMVVRWVSAAIVEAEKKFRRVQG